MAIRAARGSQGEEDAAVDGLKRRMQQGGDGGQDSGLGWVYMGEKKNRIAGAEERGVVGTSPNWVAAEEVLYQFNSWGKKKRQDFIAQAKVGGLLSPEAGEIEAARLWRTLVEEASYYGQNKKQKVSPWDIMSTYVEQAGVTGEWSKDPSNPDFEVNRLTGERRYVGPQFKTTTATDFDYTDPATAAAVATSLWQQLLGRDPGAGELDGFAEALRQAEATSPVTRSTTTEFDPVTGEAIGQTSVTEGGVTAEGTQHLASQRVKGTQEYADVQASTTYAGAFEDMVWGAPNLRGA